MSKNCKNQRYYILHETFASQVIWAPRLCSRPDALRICWPRLARTDRSGSGGAVPSLTPMALLTRHTSGRSGLCWWRRAWSAAALWACPVSSWVSAAVTPAESRSRTGATNPSCTSASSSATPPEALSGFWSRRLKSAALTAQTVITAVQLRARST